MRSKMHTSNSLQNRRIPLHNVTALPGGTCTLLHAIHLHSNMEKVLEPTCHSQLQLPAHLKEKVHASTDFQRPGCFLSPPPYPPNAFQLESFLKERPEPTKENAERNRPLPSRHWTSTRQQRLSHAPREFLLVPQFWHAFKVLPCYCQGNSEFRCGHVQNTLISLEAKLVCTCCNSHMCRTSGWQAAQLD